MECSSDNSALSNFNENSIPLKFNDNFYFNGEFKYYSGWYGCGSTISNFQTDLFGIYFEPLSLQYIFVKLEINIDYDNGREESNNTEFSFIVYKIGDDEENIKKLKRRKKIVNDDDSSDSDLSDSSDISENEEEQNEEEEYAKLKRKRIIRKKQDFSSDDDEEEEKPKRSIRKKKDEKDEEEEEKPKRKNEEETMLNVFYLDYKHKFNIFNGELRKLVREWLKLSENEIKNEKDWLQNFLENKIPKEANCDSIFNYWPLLK